MKKVLFVINPVAGGADKAQVIDRIESTFEGATIFQTQGEGDTTQIKKILNDDSYATIVAGGGDGTISLVAGIIKGQPIDLGILPLGSANGLAYELGIPKIVEEALKRITNGHAQPFDMIEINQQMMLHLADVGMNATLVKRYQHDEHRGMLGYAISALKELPNLMEHNEFEIVTPDDTFEITSPFVVIANAKGYGTGVNVNPEGETGDGRFEICCLEGISFDTYQQRISRQEKFDFHPFRIFSTTQATIKLKTKADFQIDGEYVGEVDHLDIRIHQGALRIIQ